MSNSTNDSLERLPASAGSVSDTPRTEDALSRVGDADFDADLVTADFARQMERERNELFGALLKARMLLAHINLFISHDDPLYAEVVEYFADGNSQNRRAQQPRERPMSTENQDEISDATESCAAAAGYAACDWPEDAADENGNYQNDCGQCKCKFIGHKRRHVCKVCDAKNRETWAAMSEEERQAVRRKREAEFVHWMMGQRHTEKLCDGRDEKP